MPTNPDINFKSKQDITNITGRDFNVTASKGDFSFESQYFTMETINTGSPLNFTVADKQNTVYLKLNKSAKSNLYCQYGLDFTDKIGGITINTNSANGVKINAKSPNNKAEDGVTLTMIGQDGGSASMFSILSPNGSIASTNKVETTGTARNLIGVTLTPGISTKWGYFVGTVNGTNDTIVASKDISTINGWFYGGELMFKNFGWSSGNWHKVSTNDHSLTNILVNLYNDYISRDATLDNKINRNYNTLNSNKVDWGSYNSTVSNLQSQLNNKAGNDVWTDMAEFAQQVRNAGNALYTAGTHSDCSSARAFVIEAGSILRSISY